MSLSFFFWVTFFVLTNTFFFLFFGWNCSLCWLLMVPLFPPIFVRSWEDDFSLLLLLPLLLLPLPISTITRVTKNTRYTRITKERENVVIPISFFFLFWSFYSTCTPPGINIFGGRLKVQLVYDDVTWTSRPKSPFPSQSHVLGSRETSLFRAGAVPSMVLVEESACRSKTCWAWRSSIYVYSLFG